jgi:hypothetical protein
MAGGGSDELLFVVFDDSGRCVVSLDAPVVDGQVGRTNLDGIVVSNLITQQDGEETPGLAQMRLVMGTSVALITVGTVIVSVLLTPWIGVPVGIAGVWFAGTRYDTYQASLQRRWTDRHLALRRRTEVGLLRRALRAAQAITRAWPQVRGLTQIATPREEVAAAVWALAGLLHSHQDLRIQYWSLWEARGAVPPRAPVSGDLTDRLAMVSASLHPLYKEIERRIASLETLAAECVKLVRDERAVANAYEAIRRVDQSLGRIPAVDDVSFDATHDLSERTRLIIAAYRELTGLT